MRSTGQIQVADNRAGVFWRVEAVGKGVYADTIPAGAVVAVRDSHDYLDLGDDGIMLHGSDVWCVLSGNRLLPVGPRVCIECEDPEEAYTGSGLILLRHDRDFPTEGYIMGQRCAFNNRSEQLRIGWAGKLWVVGDQVDTFVGWV